MCGLLEMSPTTFKPLCLTLAPVLLTLDLQIYSKQNPFGKIQNPLLFMAHPKGSRIPLTERLPHHCSARVFSKKQTCDLLSFEIYKKQILKMFQGLFLILFGYPGVSKDKHNWLWGEMMGSKIQKSWTWGVSGSPVIKSGFY